LEALLRRADREQKGRAVACILIVDDEANIVELISLRLQRFGHQTAWAADGRTALEMARDRHPDLILLDVMLPALNGFEVLDRLKATPDTRHIPVIMLTARGHEQDVTAGLAGGAEDYIVKPLGFPELIARVSATLARYAMR
jgi:DNA-binding response OmpR family regulator